MVRRGSGASIAALVGLFLVPMTGGLARAESPSPVGAIGLGNRGWSAGDTNQTTSANEPEFSARAGLASDYIYRGTTLSDHDDHSHGQQQRPGDVPEPLPRLGAVDGGGLAEFGTDGLQAGEQADGEGAHKRRRCRHIRS